MAKRARRQDEFWRPSFPMERLWQMERENLSLEDIANAFRQVRESGENLNLIPVGNFLGVPIYVSEPYKEKEVLLEL